MEGAELPPPPPVVLVPVQPGQGEPVPLADLDLEVEQGTVVVPVLTTVVVAVPTPQLPPGARAHAHTLLAPAMTLGRTEAGQAVATQGTRMDERLCWAAGWHWQLKSVTAQPTLGAPEAKHCCAHDGTAELATAPQSAFAPQLEVGVPVVAGDEVMGPVLPVPVLPFPVLPDEAVGEVWPVVVGGAEPLPVPVAVLLPGAVVLAVALVHGVVGLAVTQLQRAWTDDTTCRAVFRPQPLVTQASAAP